MQGKTRFSLFAGAEFAGKLRLENSDGDRIEESKYNTALIIGATFSVDF